MDMILQLQLLLILLHDCSTLYLKAKKESTTTFLLSTPVNFNDF